MTSSSLKRSGFAIHMETQRQHCQIFPFWNPESLLFNLFISAKSRHSRLFRGLTIWNDNSSINRPALGWSLFMGQKKKKRLCLQHRNIINQGLSMVNKSRSSSKGNRNVYEADTASLKLWGSLIHNMWLKFWRVCEEIMFQPIQHNGPWLAQPIRQQFFIYSSGSPAVSPNSKAWLFLFWR